MQLNNQDYNKRPSFENQQYYREKSFMQFELWFIYFDSLFARSPLRVTKTANQIFKFCQQDTAEWKFLPNLPQLTQSYQVLENFYTNIKNWVSSNCILEQLQAIESRLNEMFLMMRIEKKYARDFWDLSPRRIQASVCHFYMLFQATIEALLPGDKYSVKQYQKRYNLATRLSFLQELVNQLLVGIQKIYKFMVSSLFRQQRKLTVQFFDHINHIFRNLPQLYKQDFRKIPKLLQYLKINNPIEISNQFMDDKSPLLVRNRRATEADKSKRRDQNRLSSPDKKRKFYKQFNGFIFVIKKRSASEEVHSILQQNQSPRQKLHFKCQKIFSFPKYIYNYSLSFEKQLCSVWQRKRSKSLINRQRNNTFAFGKILGKRSSEKQTSNSSGNSRRIEESKARKYLKYINKVGYTDRSNRFKSGTMNYFDSIIHRLTKSLQKEYRFNLFSGQKVIGQKQERQDEQQLEIKLQKRCTDILHLA